MILADSSVWIDHFRKGDPRLEELLAKDAIVIHPFIIGEIALGHLRGRRQILIDLSQLQYTALASNQEVMVFIEANGLAGSGIGYLDAHLLTSVRLTGDAKLWTRDKKLCAAAESLGLAYL